MSRVLDLPAGAAAGGSFQRWWDTRGEWVEEPNRRRDGESGVQRVQLRGAGQPLLYCKRQVGHLYRSLLHPFGQPTVMREREALRAFSRLGVRVPELVYCEARRQQGAWQGLLVTAALDGFVSLEQWYADGLAQRFGARLHRRMLATVGATLSKIHRARWQHGCCYPKHIFLRVSGAGDATDVEVALLDLEKSRRRLRPLAAARHDLRQLHRHRQQMPLEDFRLIAAAHAAVGPDDERVGHVD
jgi:hypothetical protein